MMATIEAARAADLPVVLALLADAALPTDGVAEHFGGFVVARERGEVVGAGGLEVYGDAALLRSVVVEPAWRKMRLGEAVVAGSAEFRIPCCDSAARMRLHVQEEVP